MEVGKSSSDVEWCSGKQCSGKQLPSFAIISGVTSSLSLLFVFFGPVLPVRRMPPTEVVMVLTVAVLRVMVMVVMKVMLMLIRIGVIMTRDGQA